MVGNREGKRRRAGREGVGRVGRGREGWGDRIGKREEALDLDICPGAPEFLVTPLPMAITVTSISQSFTYKMAAKTSRPA